MVDVNRTNWVGIFIFSRVTVQYKAFWFQGFKDDLCHLSSVTGHASLDTILKARSHFVQRFRGNRLMLVATAILYEWIFKSKYKILHTLRTNISRESTCFHSDNLTFSHAVVLTWLILSGVLVDNDGPLILVLLLFQCFWSSPPILKTISYEWAKRTKFLLAVIYGSAPPSAFNRL